MISVLFHPYLSSSTSLVIACFVHIVNSLPFVFVIVFLAIFGHLDSHVRCFSKKKLHMNIKVQPVSHLSDGDLNPLSSNEVNEALLPAFIKQCTSVTLIFGRSYKLQVLA